MKPKRITREQRLAQSDDERANRVMEVLGEMGFLPRPKRCLVKHARPSHWRLRGRHHWVCGVCHPPVSWSRVVPWVPSDWF